MTDTIFYFIFVTHMIYIQCIQYIDGKKYKGEINESMLQMTPDARQMRECTLHKALQLRIDSDTQKIIAIGLKKDVVRYDIT